MKKFNAFTMAETITVLIIIGVIATMTIPTLIKRHQIAINRTKVSKAMVVYETAIHTLTIDKGIKTNNELLKWASSEENADCAVTRRYFKKSEEINGCRFRTTDKIWWDITDIQNPIIMLKDVYKNYPNNVLQTYAQSGTDVNTEVFAFSTKIEPETGMLHVNDKSYEEEFEDNLVNQRYMTKLFSFIYEQKSSSDIVIPNPDDIALIHVDDKPKPQEPEPEQESGIFEVKECKNANGSLCNGWVDGYNCPSSGTKILCNYKNGIAIGSKYCFNGSNGTSDRKNLETTIINKNTGEKMMFYYNNGGLSEVQYVNANKMVEVYQSKPRIAKYEYNGNTFNQSWYMNPTNNSYTWTQFQYYDAETNKYYLISLTPKDQTGTQYSMDATRNWVSDQPFNLVSSEEYSTTGTMTQLKGGKTYSRTNLENCNASSSCDDISKILNKALNAGYLDQPANKDERSLFQNQSHGEINLQDYQKYICNK